MKRRQATFPRRCRRWISTVIALLLFVSTTVIGQTIRGQIAGTITDETGATLPGVSIVLTSPALQVPQIQRISDAEGEYRFVDLPPGTYRLAYELPGFSLLVRDEMRLAAGFAARLDVVMKIGTVAETITVTGESPLIDVTNTRGGTTVTKELLTEIPNNRNFQDVFIVVGGLQIAGPPLGGGGGNRETGANNNPKTYGQAMQTNNTMEGLVVQSNEIPNFSSFDEVDVKSFGNTAEAANPSASVSMIVKSGGNQFHGRYTDFVQHKKFQSSNIDDALRRQGIFAGDAMVWLHDFTGDLGGRIVRNKLWFYVGIKDVRNDRTAPGYVDGPGPDGKYLTGDEPIGEIREATPSQTVKISYQATQNHRFIAYGSRTPLYAAENGGSRFVPREATTRHLEHDIAVKPVEWQWVVNNRVSVNVLTGQSGYIALRRLQRGSESTHSTLNRETGLTTGANFSDLIGTREPWRPQVMGRVDYFPLNTFGGSHAIQTGYRLQWGRQETNFPSQATGNYQLRYDRVGGIPDQPVEFVTQNRPVKGLSRQNLYAFYVADTWRPTKRLTLNVGVRLERNSNWVPPQVKEQGIFGSSGSFPRVDAGIFNEWSPRLGVAFDLFGDGKTVVKGTYGKFNNEWPFNFNVGFAYDYNQNNISIATYRWTDPDRNGDYTPGEVNLDLNGPDFLSISGVTSNVVNPNLKTIKTHEATASIERALGNTLSIRGLWVYKRIVDNIEPFVNIRRPYSVYNRQFTRRDPGPDGALNTADDGALITIYDYDPAYRGAAFVANMRINAAPDRYDSFNNFEVTLTKRRSARWFANASFLATKYHKWLEVVPQSPNQEFYPLNDTLELSGRLAAGYDAPFGIDLSTLIQAYNGVPRQRTNVFRAADPAGGPAFPSSGTITMRLEPFGARRGPNRTIVNLRGARTFRFAGARTVTVDVAAFNAFNSNVPWGSGGGGGIGDSAGITDASGPTYDFVTRIVNPRAMRFGIAFEF